MQKITVIKYLLQQKGGIEKRFQNYLMEFKKRGYSITVLYGSEKRSYVRIAGVIYRKVSVGVIPSRNLRKIFFAWRAKKILKSAEYKDQLKLSMGRTGYADVVIAAGNYPDTSRNDIQKSTWFRNPMFYLDKISFQDCRLIFAASELVKKELEDLFQLSPERIKVLFPPVETQDFLPITGVEKKSLFRKFNMDQGKANFLFVSTGHKRKGLSVLIDIFSSLDPEKYVLYIAGSRYDPRAPNVRYVGYVENTAELYYIADCLLHPASYEAFGQVITEALICGLPVFVSDRVGAKEIVTESNGKILPYDNPKAWLDAITNFKKKQSFDSVWLADNLNIESHVDKMLAEWTTVNG